MTGLIEVRREGMMWAAYRKDDRGWHDFPFAMDPRKSNVVAQAREAATNGEMVRVRNPAVSDPTDDDAFVFDPDGVDI